MTEIKSVNPKSASYAGDTVLVGINSLDIFKLMISKDLSGRDVKYIFKELIFDFRNTEDFLSDFFASLNTLYYECILIENSDIFLNLEIGRKCEDLLLAHIADIIYYHKEQFNVSLNWSVSYSNHDQYRVQFILPALDHEKRNELNLIMKNNNGTETIL